MKTLTMVKEGSISCIFTILVMVSFLHLVEAGTHQKFSLETRYIDVPIDHFEASSSPKNFSLRYLINAKYHAKGGPIFVYIGHKGDINIFGQNSGFLFDLAPIFNALLVFIEHRFYGQSLPFGNQTFESQDNLRYLTTHQALADFSFVIDDLKKKFLENYDTSDTAPIVAFGGSYGGLLAAWLRMKNPFIVRGAIASSAPLIYFPGLIGCDIFYEKVTQVFEKYGHEQCVKTIKLGWDVIVNLSKTKLGMDFISSAWKLCRVLKTADDVDKLIAWIENIYVNLAMFNYHYPTELYTPLPAYPAKVFCEKLTTATFNDTKGFIESFSIVLEIFTNYTGKTVCNNINNTIDDLTEYAWGFQTCTEIISPKCSTENDFFITRPWDFEKYSSECAKKYGFRSMNKEWGLLNYGGRNVKYYSNIIFSNGMLDPWSVGGIIHNVSSTIHAVNIPDAPHNVDLRNSDPADNNYITDARQFYIDTIKTWLDMA